MTNRLEEFIKISESCLCNIMRNIVEQKDCESIGDLIGKRKKLHYILINAYPWQKAETDGETANYRDFAARKRVINMDTEMREVKGVRYFIIGQYHSHIFNPKENRETNLNDEDIQFFTIQRRWLKIPELLEIIASVRIKNYKNKPKNKISLKNYKNKMRIIWRDNTRGYDVILGAYGISKWKKKPEELPIKKTN